MDIDSAINAFFKPIADVANAIVFFAIPIGAGQELKVILLLLAGAALFFTFYLGFISLRYFGHAIKLLRGDGMKVSDGGEISQFQALMASLSGTVGLGNIGGVAVAISTGGPGAAFWMTLMGFLCMSSKFAEVMLGVKYRQHNDPEHPQKISGGPMYYLREIFTRNGFPFVGAFFAYLFAFCCILGSIGGGNMYQANQTYKQTVIATGGDASFLVGYGWAFGIVLSILVGLVILGGLKSIAAVASKIVPLMAGIYIVGGLLIIIMHIGNLPMALMTIVEKAFSMEAGFGALLGGALIGVQRAAFSNEAGLGSAAIVQSTTNTDGPVGTGIVAMLGPFIDTVVICNVTALVIVITGVYNQVDGLAGVELTSLAFESGITNFKYVLSVTVFLFAYSTLIAWYYCGAVCARYVFGDRDRVETVFKVIYCLCVIVGSSAELGNMIDFADAAFLAAAFPNIIGLFLFAPEIKKDLKAYIEGLKKSA